MDLSDKSDLNEIRKWVSSKLDDTKTASRDLPYLNLLYVLLDDTTPYLGCHYRVGRALCQFRLEKQIAAGVQTPADAEVNINAK